MRKTQLALVAAICAVASCQVANATLSWSSAVGGAPTGGSRINFDKLPLGTAGGLATGPSGSVNVSFVTDGETVAGASVNVYAAPYLSGGNGNGFAAGNLNQALGVDGTQYLTTGTGEAILSFGSAQKYLGLLWGSMDTYNTLSFYNGTTLVDTLTGATVIGGTTGGFSSSGDQGINGTAYVNITSDVAFDKVIASSTSYAFEFDNVAVVPEPTTVLAGALLLLPFGVSTIRSLRRRA